MNFLASIEKLKIFFKQKDFKTMFIDANIELNTHLILIIANYIELRRIIWTVHWHIKLENGKMLWERQGLGWNSGNYVKKRIPLSHWQKSLMFYYFMSPTFYLPGKLCLIMDEMHRGDVHNHSLQHMMCPRKERWFQLYWNIPGARICMVPFCYSQIFGATL